VTQTTSGTKAQPKPVVELILYFPFDNMGTVIVLALYPVKLRGDSALACYGSITGNYSTSSDQGYVKFLGLDGGNIASL
jgi:hypothetical protein